MVEFEVQNQIICKPRKTGISLGWGDSSLHGEAPLFHFCEPPSGFPQMFFEHFNVTFDNCGHHPCYWTYLVVRWYRTCLPVQEIRVSSLDREDPLEKEMATHSSILAWRIPWTEEPGGL